MGFSENKAIEDFLAGETVEEVLEPDLPIVDPHHHLWDIRTFTTDTLGRFEQKVYLCEEIMKDINGSGHNIEQTVFAQCGSFYRDDGPEELQCVGETEFVHGIAAMSRSGIYGKTRLCTGIFGTADLRLGKGVEPVLKAHLDASPNFRGIRSAFRSDLNDTFLEGYATLAKYNLSFDNWSPDYDRLPILAKLASANTDITVIVNHLGGQIDVEADQATFNRWRECIAAVAACPNTVMKLGGAQMRSGDFEPGFHMHRCDAPLSSEALCDLLYPYYAAAIDLFGPDRCMFESNFPVDRECVSYRTLWNLLKRIAEKAGASEADKSAMFSGTAKRVYRLD
ncbi:MAG: amidohydrolase family protein [Gammaproteobacteria bacterium]|jgi:L-fuconolactonase|nr:amidohydrolase family protein [Gammaproteobacteria bacterium]MBT7370524.1 amidohydrolase family protein [Gammaproteobacteria bacterium]